MDKTIILISRHFPGSAHFIYYQDGVNTLAHPHKKQEGALADSFFFRLSPDTPSSSHTSAIFRGVDFNKSNWRAKSRINNKPENLIKFGVFIIKIEY
jgi:hypothetical protein